MPWRWGWPPWVPERLQEDHRRALQEVERSTIDLTETRRQAMRTGRVADGLHRARARNHFSESMEQLFQFPPKGTGDPRPQRQPDARPQTRPHGA